jgi:quercetin dioxygenase-like cupin family protein
MHQPTQRPGGTWDRGGSIVHMTETLDYGIVLEGQRILQLDDGELPMNPGDVVVQIGNWHGWTNRTSSSLMAFVMMGATYEG